MARPVQQHGRCVVAFSDLHIPYQSEQAVEVLSLVVEYLKPDLALCLGDILDCSQFSTHPPTYGMPESNYEEDLEQANRFLDRLQAACGRLVMVEGNHEYRLDRWAAATAPGRGAYMSLAPRLRLMRDRKHCTYIKYGSVDGRYPHYKVGPRIVGVHGWSYAKHATKNHLNISQGKSILHGHTHRVDASMRQSVWSSGKIVQARSTGCLCQTRPLYGVGSPVEWVNAFVIGYLGRRSDTLYTVPIIEGRCVLPNGMEVAA